MNGKTCEVGGCGRKHLARGMCKAHYSRWERGLPLDGPVRKYRRSNGFTKECAQCEVEKPLSEFYKRGDNPTALCKICHAKKINDRVRERAEKARLWDLEQAGKLNAGMSTQTITKEVTEENE